MQVLMETGSESANQQIGKAAKRQSGKSANQRISESANQRIGNRQSAIENRQSPIAA